jgi:hypothetical protein
MGSSMRDARKGEPGIHLFYLRQNEIEKYLHQKIK